VPGTFVINIGKCGYFFMGLLSPLIGFCLALEFVSQGLARATSHRVITPKGPEPRYSLPFFQNIRLDAQLTDHILQSKALSQDRFL
jgi:isopenicillin N synthase-like dioxygenase